jgi:hypothetical protein
VYKQGDHGVWVSSNKRTTVLFCAATVWCYIYVCYLPQKLFFIYDQLLIYYRSSQYTLALFRISLVGLKWLRSRGMNTNGGLASTLTLFKFPLGSHLGPALILPNPCSPHPIRIHQFPSA